MCRNIHQLYNFDPPATDEEIRAAAEQYVRKVSGFAKPSHANEAAFARAVDAVALAVGQLLDELVTRAPPKDRAVEAAKKVNSRRLVVLTGNELGGMPRSEQMANAAAALRYAAPILEKNGITAVVEILNTYVDHAGYFLYYVRDGAELIERVGSPNVRLLFDIYHVQIMEGNLIENIRMNTDRIGHFHIGDVPGRNEPGTGEINYRNVFKVIYELSERFPGYAALEYRPKAPLEENLAAMRQLANFS